MNEYALARLSDLNLQGFRKPVKAKKPHKSKKELAERITTLTGVNVTVHSGKYRIDMSTYYNYIGSYKEALTIAKHAGIVK